ncbi:MAG: hypothetical protein H7Z41_16330, partial [Cytophagales bacterium]|nr:hypothetical protein [Armatimonadota bacterium]
MSLLPSKTRRVPFFAVVSTVAIVGAAVTLPLLLLPSAADAAAVGRGWGPRPKREGDILRLFDRQTVYVITNDDPEIADALLENCGQKARRILTPDEWQRMPSDTRWFVSPVFLINRERLPDGVSIPAACPADGDEVWTEVRRFGRQGGVSYEVTLSAPDSTWLRRAVSSFRTLKETPRQPLRRNVRSVAVVPIGAGAHEAAELLVQQQDANDDFNKRSAAHLLPAALLRPSGKTPARSDFMDEVILVDRGSAKPGDVPLPPPGVTLPSPGDTVTWREAKPDGHARIVYSAPSAGALFEAIRRPGNTLSVPEALTVLSSARDLRTVRRVAVAGVRNGAGG